MIERMLRCAVVVALAACTACGSAGPDLDPDIPDDAVPYPPPGIYRFWWGQLSQEAAIPSPFPPVLWYEVRGGPWRDGDGERIHGLWIPGRIYLAEGVTRNEGAVKHEMLHELLQGDPEHTHPLFELYYLWQPLP